MPQPKAQTNPPLGRPTRAIRNDARNILRCVATLLLLILSASIGHSVDGQAPGNNAPARADSGPAREAWRLQVEPLAVIGSGRPGVLAADIDKPDGIEFTPSGLLLITDAGNRRVQVWDVRSATRLGEFGRGHFGGEITNIAIAPNGTVYVADSDLNLVYAFAPPEPSDNRRFNYKFLGTRFGEQGFRKLGGMAIDSRGRIYIADGNLWEVRRFTPDCKPDPTWRFERTLSDGDTVLHRCEGMAIDEQRGLLYVASEADSVIKVFDLETGAFKRSLIGAKPDREGRPAGVRIFNGSVEGLAIINGHLLAVDEEIGHIHVWDMSRPDFLDADLPAYAAARQNGASAYKGFFGRSPRVNFDVDDTANPDLDLKRRVEEGAVIPGIVNPPGHFCSPDEVAAYVDTAGGEAYVAVADQCNFRVVVYRWSEIQKAIAARSRSSSR